MSRLLPQHRKTVVTCTHCPRLCRYACPVVEAEARETVTPTNLMSVLHLMQTGHWDDPWTVSSELFDHCTLCGRCSVACEHDLKPWQVLLDARIQLRRGTVSPGWSADRYRSCKATLSAMLKRLDTKQGKWVLLGRDLVANKYGNALYDLAESVYRKHILSLDPVLSIMLDEVERGYTEAFKSLVPMLAEVLERADQLFLFDDQTRVLVDSLLASENVSLGRCRSGWQLFLDLVQKSEPRAVTVQGSAAFIASCGLRNRDADVQAIGRILDTLGIADVRLTEDARWTGCCGGGGYPEELVEDVANWSSQLPGASAAVLIGDRTGCTGKYAASQGAEWHTVLELIARGYGV